MLAKFGTNSGGITWWSKFELIQVLKWIQIQYSWKDNSSYKLYTLGPLCLWQCFCSWSLKVSQVCHQMHLWHCKRKIFYCVGNPRSKHSRKGRIRRIQLSGGRSQLFSQKVSGWTTQLRGREDGHMARMSEKLRRMRELQLLYKIWKQKK